MDALTRFSLILLAMVFLGIGTIFTIGGVRGCLKKERVPISFRGSKPRPTMSPLIALFLGLGAIGLGSAGAIQAYKARNQYPL
jgi:hypothetical protein